MTYEQLAAKEKEQLKSQYENIATLKKDNYYANLILESKLHNYRVASAERVISFVARNVEKLNKNKIEVYLVHCLNKLNGNIDGIELDITFDKNIDLKETLNKKNET